MSALMPETVTDAQGRVLHNIEQKGDPGLTMRSRSGGAMWRMLRRMIDARWIEPSPWRLGELGMAALKQYQHRLIEREARFMRKGSGY